MKKFTLILVVLLLLLQVAFGAPLIFGFAETSRDCMATANFQSGDFFEDVGELFVGSSASRIDEEVYLGGYPLGITIDGDGVTVIGLNEFIAQDGSLCCPALLAGVEINDVVVELDGKKIYNSAKLAEIATKSDGKPLALSYLRDGVLKQTEITPQKDLSAGQYRLGLWTRDSSSGIGTLTYVRKNLKFGSLGHPICDAKGNVIACKNGGVFACSIDGIEKGQKGAAGELKGSFCFDRRVGNIYTNNKFGAYGTFTNLPQFCTETIPVADIGEIKPGNAEILCTLDDNERHSYRIEIVKATPQSTRDDKGMVIHITDRDLIAKTGGIVQGMSGSPIVQNGKLVGAVTHVFVNDPTRGYGIFAKWMLTN